jgi:glycosyltransferase involved in cell wall biosynthesis
MPFQERATALPSLFSVAEHPNGSSRATLTPRITVLVTLYDCAREVPDLVEMILAQRHPEYGERQNWMRTIFIEDGSGDATLRILEQTLAAKGNPPEIRVRANAKNLGLSASLNAALRECETEYVLTCQCDCRFGSPAYVAEMLALLEGRPNAGAITGQPMANQPIHFKEKINLVENIQDILPSPTLTGDDRSRELLYTGFAEGRADGFRLDAMRAAGYYDTTLRVSGEDQVLSGRFRELGYDVYQAPGLGYFMSLSSQQDSVRGMLRKQYIWGKTHPYILLRARETLSGVFGRKAGSNRRLRVLLRASQAASVLAYAVAAAAVLAKKPGWALLIVAGVLLLKALIFQKHVRRVKMNAAEVAYLAALQPAFDLVYVLGLARGLISLVKRTPGDNI